MDGPSPLPSPHRMGRGRKLAAVFLRQTTFYLASLIAALLAADSAMAAKPPAPFTPIAASRSSFSCLSRKTLFGPLLLPGQISAARGNLLASPIRVSAEPESCLAINAGSKRTRVVSRAEDSVVWESSAESPDFWIKTSLTADCDGFCWYEIRLEPRHSVSLRRLALEIPRTKSTARYLHTSSYDWSNVSQGLPELGGKWSGSFVPYVWLGDEERGLAWCAESSPPLEMQPPNRAISIETSNDIVLLKINFLNQEQTITSPIMLRFGLQASPVKPVSFAWRAKARILHDIHYDSYKPGTNGICELDRLQQGGVKTVVIHDSWTRYFGQMIPADAEEFRRLINACHQRGLRLLVYVGYGIARTAPELQGQHDLWSTMPLIPWDPGYKPETRGFDATCPNSPWADWLVDGAEKLFNNFDLDGLYLDGTSEAWRCNNIAHGCGWKDAQGHVHVTYPILAARRLMQGLAETVHRHNRNAILDVHMSSNLTLPTLSFCDSLWNGEQFESHAAAEKFQVPLHVFRTEFMGYAHGMDMEFLCYENRPFAFNEAIALAWLHGIEVRPYPNTLHYVTPIWRAMDEFGVAKAAWHPYWQHSPVSSDNENTKVSAWTRNGKALVIVSHLQRTNETVHLRFDRRELGLKTENLRVTDAITSAALPVTDKGVDLTFTGMSWRLLRVE